MCCVCVNFEVVHFGKLLYFYLPDSDVLKTSKLVANYQLKLRLFYCKT